MTLNAKVRFKVEFVFCSVDRRWRWEYETGADSGRSFRDHTVALIH